MASSGGREWGRGWGAGGVLKSAVWLGAGCEEGARSASAAPPPSAPSSPRRVGRPLAPPPPQLPPAGGAPGAGAGRSLWGRILTSVQGRVILGVRQLRGYPEPSQCGAARRQGAGGMKHGQDRKQSQQVTWQVPSALCNESRGMCDAFRAPTPFPSSPLFP